MRKPSLFLMFVRVVVLTVLATLAGFAIALFISVVGILVTNLIRGGGSDLTYAYRNVALPIAAIVFVMSFFAALSHEIRVYRRQRAAAREMPRAA